MSWSVAKGSSHSQTGPMSALRMARPTQPYTQVKSVPTSASDEPPTTNCATTQSQAVSPSSRSPRTTGRGTRRVAVAVAGRQRPSWAKAMANDSATATAAPARYTTSGSGESSRPTRPCAATGAGIAEQRRGERHERRDPASADSRERTRRRRRRWRQWVGRGRSRAGTRIDRHRAGAREWLGARRGRRAHQRQRAHIRAGRR